MTDMQAPPSGETSWPPRRACTANACSSGKKPCPCPEACEVPDGTALGWVLDRLERVSLSHFAIGYAVAFVAGLIALRLMAS